MGQVDFLYWKLAAVCFVVAIAFFFFTTESLVRGKLQLPAWVFSSFTFVVGAFFFSVFLNSLTEFRMGAHYSLDELLDAWDLVSGFAFSVTRFWIA